MSQTAPIVDVEALVVAALLADVDVTAVLGTNVGASLPSGLNVPGTPRLPFGRVFRLPGTFADPATAWLERARLQCDAWAASKPAAFDAAQAMVRAIIELPGSHPLGVITDTDLDATPYYAPDPDTNLPRYIFTTTVTVHPPVFVPPPGPTLADFTVDELAPFTVDDLSQFTV